MTTVNVLPEAFERACRKFIADDNKADLMSSMVELADACDRINLAPAGVKMYEFVVSGSLTGNQDRKIVDVVLSRETV